MWKNILRKILNIPGKRRYPQLFFQNSDTCIVQFSLCCLESYSYTWCRNSEWIIHCFCQVQRFVKMLKKCSVQFKKIVTKISHDLKMELKIIVIILAIIITMPNNTNALSFFATLLKTASRTDRLRTTCIYTRKISDSLLFYQWEVKIKCQSRSFICTFLA